MRLLRVVLLLAATSSFLFADFGDNVYFTYQVGGTIPAVQTSSITSTIPNTQITGAAVHTSGQSWLYASISSTVTPLILSIGVNPVGLTPGSYTATVELTCLCSNVLDYYVYLTVTPAPPPLTASTTTLVFNAVQGSSPPAAQNLILGSALPTGTAIFSTTTPSPLPAWLKLSNSTFWVGVFNAPATLPLSVDPTNLSPGTYTASIKFYTILPDSSVTVTITLYVSAPPPVLKTSVNSLQFSYVLGASAPAVQTVQVTSSSTPLAASVTLGASWLTATTLSGTTPFSTNVGVNVNGLAIGTYTGQVTIATTMGPIGPPATQVTMNVTFTVAADTRPVITSVVNGASYKSPISPGAWVSIMGKNLSTSAQQAISAWLPTSLNGVSVTLSGVGGAYTLLVDYVSPTQINAFVPHEVSPTLYGATGGGTVTVTAPGGTASYSVDCEAIAPALFTYGTNNYVAAEFPDYVIVGTIPGTRAATSGSIISLYGTGFGQTNPVAVNINGPVTVRTLAFTPTVTVGGLPAIVDWAGMVGIGLYQFNIEIPTMPGPGDYPVVVQIGGTSSVAAMVPVR